MNRIHFTRALTMGAALALSGAVGHSQTMAPQDGAANDRMMLPGYQRTEPLPTMIRVKNIPAEIMAYWLDPAGQPAPTPIQNARNQGDWANRVNNLTRQPGNGNGPRGLQLPPDVKIVTAISPQSVILARGTTEGIAALKKLVAEIDVPLQQVEIEVQIWEIAPDALEQLPLKFYDNVTAEERVALLGDVPIVNAPETDEKTDEKYEPIFSGSLARTALAAPLANTALLDQKLSDLRKNRRAFLLTAPRVTAIDGLAAELSSLETRALMLGETDPNTDAEAEEMEAAPAIPAEMPMNFEPGAPNDNWSEGFATLSSHTGIRVVPVRHGELTALAFQITVDNHVTEGSSIMREGEILPIRLANRSFQGRARLALISLKWIRRGKN